MNNEFGGNLYTVTIVWIYYEIVNFEEIVCNADSETSQMVLNKTWVPDHFSYFLFLPDLWNGQDLYVWWMITDQIYRRRKFLILRVLTLNPNQTSYDITDWFISAYCHVSTHMIFCQRSQLVQVSTSLGFIL